MPAINRDLSITYAGVEAGGSTNRLIHGPWDFERTAFEAGRNGKASLKFQLLITAASNSAFVTERIAVEAAFSTARAALLITLGGNTHVDLDPADGTGYESVATIGEVRGSIYNTSRSRLYDVSVVVTLPVDLAGQAGLRDVKVSRGYTPARVATITLTGAYTQVGTTNARDQYDAQKAALFTAKKSATDLDDSATFEKQSEEATTNDTVTLCEFRLVYRELIINESVSALDDADIVAPTLKIMRSQTSENSPEDTGLVPGEPTLARTPGGPGPGKATPAVELVATYDCWIDKNTSTNPQDKWTSKIRPWILQQLRVHAVNGQLAVVAEAPAFDRYENKVSATVRAIVFGSRLISFSLETDDQTDDGHTVAEVWSQVPTDAYVFQRPARAMRLVTRISRFTGTLAPPSAPTVEPLKQGPGWIPQGPRRSRPKRLKIGLGTDTVDGIELTETFAMRYVTKPGVDVSGGLAGRK